MSVKIAQVGCGYWGVNLLRVFSHVAKITAVVEENRKTIDNVKKINPNARFEENLDETLKSRNIDALVIATPAKTHYDIAKKALLHDKHVFVEKPLATNTEEARELIKLSKQKNRVLMVGHTFLYNQAVRMLHDYVQNNEIGRVYYCYSQRLNLGRVRTDINAMWNFAPHDISIISYVLDKKAVRVWAHGNCYIQQDIEDLAFVTIEYEDGVLGHIHVSWLDPNKTRQMTIVGEDKMIVYNDMIEAKLAIYDKGVNQLNNQAPQGGLGAWQLTTRSGDILLPKVDFKEPLLIEAGHFIDCIIKGEKPLTDGHNGLQTVSILEAAQKSLKNNGRCEMIEQTEEMGKSKVDK